MRIYDRGGIWYVDCYYHDANGRRCRHRESTGVPVQGARSQQSARTAGVRIQGALIAGARAKRGTSPTVPKAIEMLIEHLDTAGRSPATIGKHAEKGRHLSAYWPTTELTAIGPAQLSAYIDAGLAAGRSRHTLHMEVRTLRQAWMLAQERGLVDKGPPPAPDLGRYYVPRDRWLPQAEVAALLPQVPERWREHVLVVLQLGLRAGELYDLVAADIRTSITNDGTSITEAHVRGTKTPRADRWIPLPAVAAAILHRRAQDRPQGPLFDPWTNVSKDLARACKRAQIGRCCLTDLRRTYATELILAGVPPRVVQDLMGHADGRMIERIYAQVSGDARQAAATKVPRYTVPDMCRGECQIVPLNAARRTPRNRKKARKNPRLGG